MKSINNSGTSSVIFRLNKVSQYVTPYYIFELENQNSKIKTLFTGLDISPVPLQYNEFEWVNGVTFSATQSRFNLDSGNYFLNIYETEFQGITNSASASILYKGEIKIEGNVIPNTTYYTGGDNDTTIYFE